MLKGADLPQRELLEMMLEKLAGLPDALRQSLTDHLWATIPAQVSEWAYNAALAANTAMVVNRQTDNFELIRTIVAVVPSGATGTIQFGNIGPTIPVPAGVTVIPFLSFLLPPADVRKLTLSGGSGAALLWLLGEQAPTTGVLAH